MSVEFKLIPADIEKLRIAKRNLAPKGFYKSIMEAFIKSKEESVEVKIENSPVKMSTVGAGLRGEANKHSDISVVVRLFSDGSGKKNHVYLVNNRPSL